MTDERIELGDWGCSREGVVRIALEVFKGKAALDVRRWYFDDDGNEHPTQKGVRIPPDCFDLIRAAMDEIERLISVLPSPRARAAHPRAKKTNPRSKGTNPRAVRWSPPPDPPCGAAGGSVE